MRKARSRILGLAAHDVAIGGNIITIEARPRYAQEGKLYGTMYPLMALQRKSNAQPFEDARGLTLLSLPDHAAEV